MNIPDDFRALRELRPVGDFTSPTFITRIYYGATAAVICLATARLNDVLDACEVRH